MRMTWLAATATLALSACSSGGDNATTPAPTEAATTETTAPGVTRDAIAAPTPAQTPMPAVPVIQTQPGPKGNTVALNKAQVTGDILTVALTFNGTGDCCVHIPIEDVSVIDDATSQRIGVLKDNTGKWMASPLESSGKTVSPTDHRGASQVWFKFPAPPASSPTVSIAIPGVAPLDAVPVTR